MIGYSLKDYNPCVDYNKDRFCGTPAYHAMMRNLEARQVMPPTSQTTYNAVRNGPFAGPYTFTAVGKTAYPCGRDQWYHGAPCSK